MCIRRAGYFVYLGLGSNRGDRAQNLDAAVLQIEQLVGIDLMARSKVYETPPMGPQDQSPYLNMTVWIETDLHPQALFDELQAIETRLGREAREHRRHWGPRKIDIDLLIYDDQVIDSPTLTVPHPGMHERWFVLKPLTDLQPEDTHPLLGKTFAELLSAVENQGTPQGVAI